MITQIQFGVETVTVDMKLEDEFVIHHTEHLFESTQLTGRSCEFKNAAALNDPKKDFEHSQSEIEKLYQQYMKKPQTVQNAHSPH